MPTLSPAPDPPPEGASTEADRVIAARLRAEALARRARLRRHGLLPGRPDAREIPPPDAGDDTRERLPAAVLRGAAVGALVWAVLALARRRRHPS